MSRTLQILLFLMLPLACSQAQTVSYTSKHKDLPCLDKQFTVFAHIIQDSFASSSVTKESIQMAFTWADSVFAPICISFGICQFDTFPYYQFDTLNTDDIGKLREMERRYNLDEVINVYIVSKTSLEGGHPNFGYAEQYGIDMIDSGSLVISKDLLLTEPKWVTHFLGHFFGLLDTGQNPGELVDGSNCTTHGDMICDTPADPNIQVIQGDLSGGRPCRLNEDVKDANGDYYLPDMGNIMSEYWGCHCGFSYEQYKLMALNYLEGLNKKW